MKKLILPILLFICCFTYAQDIIIKNNGDTIKCKINAVGGEALQYSLPGVSNSNVIMLTDIRSYKYEQAVPVIKDAVALSASQYLRKASSLHLTSFGLTLCGLGAVVLIRDEGGLIAGGIFVIIALIVDNSAWLNIGNAGKAMEQNRITLLYSNDGIGLAFRF